MRPIRLGANTPRTFYRDSGAIAAFRGEHAATSDHRHPEDWVASTTSLFGQQTAGQSTLPDGRLLSAAIEADPAGWLGADHVARYGADPKLLVKLLDTGERLPVHVHPGRGFARQQLGSASGKTEAWIILEAGDDAAVHLGFNRDVDAAELSRWCRTQDTERLLAATNRIPVSVGDTVLVPAGLPHAIGAGILLAELQEPTDFSIFLEWKGFDVPDPLDGQLGLPFDVALGCVERSEVSADALDELESTRSNLLFPVLADPFFRAERIQVPDSGPATLEPGYGVLIGLDGTGALEWNDSEAPPMPVSRGETILIPFGAGPVRISGDFRGILARPPA